MKTWKHLERHGEYGGHAGHSHGFTSIELPPELIGPELEAEAGGRGEYSVSGLTPVVHAAAAGTRRIDQKDMGALGAAYRGAVEKLVADGSYRTLVMLHTEMSHNMHGTMGPVGMMRFLAWHRRYLLAFEELLRAADAQLRPGAPDRISIPYWRWPDPFPEWLVDFNPAGHPVSSATLPARRLTAPPEKPLEGDLTLLISGYQNQLPGARVNDYMRFTYGLEGWGQRPNGTSLPAHNHVHDWVGGIMGDTRFSPTDPVFWLHHAEVDRLWSIWQAAHPTLHPPLQGNARVMDPWPETYDQLAVIASLGYEYARMTP